MQSIKHNTPTEALPNFRNLGVAMRIAVIVNVMALLVAVVQAGSWGGVVRQMIALSAYLQPALLSSLLLLFVLNGFLARIKPGLGVLAVVMLVIAATLVIYGLFGGFEALAAEDGYYIVLRPALLAAFTALLLLAYFRLRAHVLSPALHEARLQALQARIRPHFLFNTINAVLGIVRSDPKRAETALEDMADLFRMAMAHNGDQVPMREEMALARQYLALEQLRLGDRLKVDWQMVNIPDDAMIPPLILQPLLENAVYHGIEPLAEGGTVTVRLHRDDRVIHLEVQNPLPLRDNRHAGNRIALSNIRERLALQFDLEANYAVESGGGYYHVHVTLPYVREVKK